MFPASSIAYRRLPELRNIRLMPYSRGVTIGKRKVLLIIRNNAVCLVKSLVVLEYLDYLLEYSLIQESLQWELRPFSSYFFSYSCYKISGGLDGHSPSLELIKCLFNPKMNTLCRGSLRNDGSEVLL